MICTATPDISSSSENAAVQPGFQTIFPFLMTMKERMLKYETNTYANLGTV